MRILFDSKNLTYKSPFGCIAEGEKCTIAIDIPRECHSLRVVLYMENVHSKKNYSFDLKLCKNIDLYERYRTEISLSETGLYFYKFIITTPESTFSLYKQGCSDTNIESGSMWQLSCIPKDYTVPDKFKGRVMYQIFPDRFHSEGECDLTDKLSPYTIHEDKNVGPLYAPDANGKVLNSDFYGGNLKGIEAKLGYLKELGVEIIYLNPIFKAYSNHRYDTCDYKTIDPMLGTEEDFAELCEAAHSLGISIILDGVFSHTGSNSIYFDKDQLFGNGAYSNPKSPYRSWYNFSEYPDKYDAWWGIDTLPAVNEMDEQYLNYIINDEDSVIAHWIKLGADGYRLDVADELPDEFIYLLRKRLKEIKPDSYLIGEVWEDASNKISYDVRRKYFVGAELDSVMNYVYKNAIIDFVCGNISCEKFADIIMSVAENYPADSLHCLMNSLSTHDTARIITCLSGVSFPSTKDEQARHNLDREQYAKACKRLFLAAFLQYTMPGNPCIYYGDEIGMYGFGDPFCREYFKWDNINDSLLNLFKALGKIKRSSKALQTGDISFEISGKLLKFTRKSEKDSFTALINMSDTVYVLDSEDVLISHLASTVGDKIYINKGGFVGYIE